METDTLNRKNCASQGLAEDSTGEASSHSTAYEKVELSLGPAWGSGQQEQLMIHQMEQLQRVVSEQQKIITLYNPGKNMEPLPPHHETSTKSLPRQDTEEVKHVAGDEVSLLHEESWLKTLSPIEEENGEQQIDEHLLSSLGRRMYMMSGIVEDGPIGDGISMRQKTFEESVKEQLKVESQPTEKQQQNSCETKVTARKSFLKHREGTVRLEGKRETLGQEPTKLLRKVSFECQDHLSWPAEWDTRKLLGEPSQLKEQVSDSAGLSMDDKDTNSISPSSYVECQVNNCEQKLEERKGSRDTSSQDDEELVNEKGPAPSQISWSKCLQACHRQTKEIMAKVTEKTEGLCPSSQEYLGGTDSRFMDSKAPVWLVEGSISQLPGRSLNASPDVSELPNLEIRKQISHVGQCSRLQVTQHANGIRQCENKYCVAVGKSPEIQGEIGPGFKKLNDRIVKIGHKPVRKQETTIANAQREHHNSAGHCNRWKGHVLSDPNCTSTDSEDEPKSHCSLYSIRPSSHRATNTDRNLDLSDADYATDEASGAEDLSWKGQGILPVKKYGAQKSSGQQETSLTASSSSESSAGFGRLNSRRKALSPRRKSPCHPSKITGRGRKPKTKNNDNARNSTEFSLQPSSLTSDLVTSLFPIFKTRANLEDESITLEQFQKRPADKLDKWEGGVQVHHRENSLLAQMKAEQTKAMDSLRRQINQSEAIRPLKLHQREECKNEEVLKLLNEKAEFEKCTTAIKVEGRSGEIQILKQQIAGLQEEFRRNESYWHVAHGKLRSQVEALTKQNQELQDELRASEYQRMETERKHGAADFIGQKAEIPVVAAFSRGTSAQETLEDRPTRSSHKSDSNMHVGRKMSLGELVSNNTQGKEKCKKFQRSLQSSEQISSATTSKRNSIISSGRKTPVAHLVTSVDAEAKISPPKSILSRRTSLYVESKKDEEVKERIEYPDGKVEQLFSDGCRVIRFRNGTKKEISADKRTTVVTFFNGDIKRILPDQRVIYYYADAQTTHTIFPGGLEVLQFPNNQIEKHHPDGTKEIVFPDQTVKRLYDGGLEETVFPDGTVVKVEKNGAKTVLFNNGQKEIHTAQFKRREYPDGTVKTVYANGRQETKYSSGRVRVKDEKGSFIVDQK
ncbi:centromere protein J-like [Tiliqua scincoides]|uniref:centromere protein J-like n=1 Tax=Tiliqua scincoides TaxID=71010 RepID=UPI0034630F53